MPWPRYDCRTQEFQNSPRRYASNVHELLPNVPRFFGVMRATGRKHFLYAVLRTLCTCPHHLLDVRATWAAPPGICTVRMYEV